MAFIPAALGAIGTALGVGTPIGGGALAASTASVVAGTAATAATVVGAKSLLSKPQKQVEPVQQAAKPVAVPKIEDARATAVADVAKRRKTILRTGGETNITKGLALVPEANIGRKSLIGG